jgi:hypothetical protein
MMKRLRDQLRVRPWLLYMYLLIGLSFVAVGIWAGRH